MPVCGCSSSSHTLSSQLHPSRLGCHCCVLACRRSLARITPFIRACNTSCGWSCGAFRAARSPRLEGGAVSQAARWGARQGRLWRTTQAAQGRVQVGDLRACRKGDSVAKLMIWLPNCCGSFFSSHECCRCYVGGEDSSWAGVRATSAESPAGTGCAGHGQCVGVGGSCAYMRAIRCHN
jgi:hypothetical protein